jgi:cation diffusion facilitator family transporter
MNLIEDKCCAAETCGAQPTRTEHLGKALQLEYLTVGWNAIEGIVAVLAALAAGSIALLGFGIDSFVECSSGLVMIWRLRAERNRRASPVEIERIEHRARKLVAMSLFALAAFVGFESCRRLIDAERPDFTLVGVVLTTVSLLVMQWLARAKHRLARALKSGAMKSDAFQTTACMWLSAAALAGIALNGVLGWWWADPIAALVIAILIAREAREAWKGEDCC